MGILHNILAANLAQWPFQKKVDRQESRRDEIVVFVQSVRRSSKRGGASWFICRTPLGHYSAVPHGDAGMNRQ